jgi:hypothetical protein
MKQLSRSKITIHRLKQVFGCSSEKKNRLKKSNSDIPQRIWMRNKMPLHVNERAKLPPFRRNQHPILTLPASIYLIVY